MKIKKYVDSKKMTLKSMQKKLSKLFQNPSLSVKNVPEFLKMKNIFATLVRLKSFNAPTVLLPYTLLYEHPHYHL